MMLLYDSAVSGNCYKVRLLLSHLGIPYERMPVSVVDRSNRGELFAGKNPAGRVPVLRLEDGRHLPESNAILWYLAESTPYLPGDRLERAQVLQWMFFEQYDHEPNVAVARFLLQYSGKAEEYAEIIAQRQVGGRKALGAMEEHLQGRDFLVAGTYSIADIALYAYTHVADEAGIDLADTPAVQAWLARVASQPGHVELMHEAPDAPV